MQIKHKNAVVIENDKFDTNDVWPVEWLNLKPTLCSGKMVAGLAQEMLSDIL